MAKTLAVTAISTDIKTAAVKKLFETIGPVVSAFLLPDNETGVQLAQIEMKTPEDAQTAITKLNGTRLGLYDLVVKMKADPPRGRAGGRCGPHNLNSRRFVPTAESEDARGADNSTQRIPDEQHDQREPFRSDDAFSSILIPARKQLHVKNWELESMDVVDEITVWIGDDPPLSTGETLGSVFKCQRVKFFTLNFACGRAGFHAR